MAQTLHLGIDEFGSPGMFTAQWERVLTTINHMRSGNWGGAAELMHKVRIATTIQERAWIESKCDAFHERMLEISDESLRYNNFRGWDEYGQWMDTMESDVLPKLQEAEHELLKQIEPGGKEG